MQVEYKAGRTRATPWRHAVAFVCGGDIASHRFPLFRCQTVHTSVRGERLWRSVADPSPQRGVVVLNR